jgi:microcystin-dependent protein
MSTEPFIGEVKILGFPFAPRGYMLCSGQTLSIAEYTALFALLGTIYGGNGTTTFNLPDLQGRIPIGQGAGPGLPDYSLGEAAGSPQVTMLSSNMPAHIHTAQNVKISLKVNNSLADSGTSAGAHPGTSNTNVWAENSTPNVFMASDVAVVTGNTDITGSSFPFSVVNPYLVINYSIAVEGIFPSRN